MTVTDDVKTDLAALVAALVKNERWSDFEPGGNCHDPESGNDPSGLQITVSTNDGSSWGYQTGDNSYAGGAYGGRHWAVTYLYPDSDTAAVVDEIVSQWEDLAAQSE